MGQFTVANSSEKKITLRFKQTADEKLAHNWKSIKPEIPPEQGDSTTYLNKLNGFWQSVKQKNPLWIPFSLGTGDVEEIQAEIDRLTRKARKKESFAETEKEFLKSLYGWIAWGGLAKWYPEASQLLRHYLNGNGSPLTIDSYIYRSSVIVKYAMDEIKKIIIDDIKRTGTIRNNGTIDSPGTVRDNHRNEAQQKTLGEVRNNGYLLTEQNNKRLKNADNQFPLYSKSAIIRGNSHRIQTQWSVRSVWDYDSIEKQRREDKNRVTSLDLPSGKELLLPDGLSEYLTQLGIANVFDYNAEWEESWGTA